MVFDNGPFENSICDLVFGDAWNPTSRQHHPHPHLLRREILDFKHRQNQDRKSNFQMDRYRRPLRVRRSDWYRSKGTFLYFQLVTTVLFFVNNFVFIFRKNCWNLVSKTNFCQFVFTNIWGRKSGNDKYLNIHSMPIQDFRYALRLGFDAKVYQFLCRSEVVMRFSITPPMKHHRAPARQF